MKLRACVLLASALSGTAALAQDRAEDGVAPRPKFDRNPIYPANVQEYLDFGLHGHVDHIVHSFTMARKGG